jgi:hypothetical protein
MKVHSEVFRVAGDTRTRREIGNSLCAASGSSWEDQGALRMFGYQPP